jgi:DNA adenine methylase
MTTQIQKPFLKWVGGKTQIIQQIINHFPTEMNNYHEIFLGGGSVLFALLSLRKSNNIKVNGKIYAYDLNQDLINLYQVIKTNPIEFFTILNEFKETYHNITTNTINRKPETLEEALTSKESYYYWIRKQFNNTHDNEIQKSAMFLFLNKTCFRGLYRTGPNGFNVPYGHYKTTPTIITEDDLNSISELISDVNFICADFTNSIQQAEPNDYLYLDPPYAPETKKSFVGYTADGFDLKTHNNLFNLIKTLDESIKFTLSNSKVDMVTEAFEHYNQEDVNARRAINSKKPDSVTTEVIISN